MHPKKMVERYNYKTLRKQDEIRLLTLYPEAGSGEINCTLRHVLLSSKPTFEAVSYAWGDPSLSKRVLCDGRKLFVTENLFTALKNLRFPDKERLIWVDGLCIDQTSNAEKNHQLPLMQRIYSDARKVLIWLGEDSGNEAREMFPS